jgi:hypothetical protein
MVDLSSITYIQIRFRENEWIIQKKNVAVAHRYLGDSNSCFPEESKIDSKHITKCPSYRLVRSFALGSSIELGFFYDRGPFFSLRCSVLVAIISAVRNHSPSSDIPLAIFLNYSSCSQVSSLLTYNFFKSNVSRPISNWRTSVCILSWFSPWSYQENLPADGTSKPSLKVRLESKRRIYQLHVQLIAAYART